MNEGDLYGIWHFYDAKHFGEEDFSESLEVWLEINKDGSFRWYQINVTNYYDPDYSDYNDVYRDYFAGKYWIEGNLATGAEFHFTKSMPYAYKVIQLKDGKLYFTEYEGGGSDTLVMTKIKSFPDVPQDIIDNNGDRDDDYNDDGDFDYGEEVDYVGDDPQEAFHIGITPDYLIGHWVNEDETIDGPHYKKKSYIYDLNSDGSFLMTCDVTESYAGVAETPYHGIQSGFWRVVKTPECRMIIFHILNNDGNPTDYYDVVEYYMRNGKLYTLYDREFVKK